MDFILNVSWHQDKAGLQKLLLWRYKRTTRTLFGFSHEQFRFLFFVPQRQHTAAAFIGMET